ncbi:hypothetical protein PJ900_04955 (plasmid) [Tistrella mobilis]|uniref:hypothetical protein n=1 Tax=Tistrella mobilis TaxID=171437 RepID=UPI0035589A0C
MRGDAAGQAEHAVEVIARQVGQGGEVVQRDRLVQMGVDPIVDPAQDMRGKARAQGARLRGAGLRGVCGTRLPAQGAEQLCEGGFGAQHIPVGAGRGEVGERGIELDSMTSRANGR